MMMHPGPAVLLAHADGELPAEAAGEIAGHIADCTVCEARISELRVGAGLFAATLRVVDASEPAGWSPPPAGGPARDERVLARQAVRPVQVRRTLRSSSVLRWAAGILLVTSATAAAAVLGVRVISGTGEPATTMVEPIVERGIAAVIVRPVDGTLNIDVSGAGAGARLFIVLEDRSTASVGVEGDTPPRFRTVEGRVAVDLSGASSALRLTLPRTLRNVTVTAGGVTRATVERDRVSPAAARDGMFLNNGGL